MLLAPVWTTYKWTMCLGCLVYSVLVCAYWDAHLHNKHVPIYLHVCACSCIFSAQQHTSRMALTASFVVSGAVMFFWASYFFSKNSLTTLEFWPTAFEYHSEYVPDGSVRNSLGVPSVSNPAKSADMPKGRAPPL